MKTKEGRLEELCPYSRICDHSSREICSGDYKTCENYRLFKKEKVMVEKLPPGICYGAIKTFPERHTRGWKHWGIGRMHQGSFSKTPRNQQNS